MRTRNPSAAFSDSQARRIRETKVKRTDEWSLISLSESTHDELGVNRKVQCYLATAEKSRSHKFPPIKSILSFSHFAGISLVRNNELPFGSKNLLPSTQWKFQDLLCEVIRNMASSRSVHVEVISIALFPFQYFFLHILSRYSDLLFKASFAQSI